ncbi:diguanylate cyclase, partial [Arthrospira platensis SPKY2]
GDLVGRLGGNRFALFLHDSDTARTQMLLEQIRQALTEGLAEPSGTKVAALGLGARFGVAAATPDSDFNDYTDLLKTADQAMHRGKLKTARQAD